jgi:hypothetical protein
MAGHVSFSGVQKHRIGLPVSHSSGSDSIPGQLTWDLWWKSGNLVDSLLLFCFFANSPPANCSTFINNHIIPCYTVAILTMSLDKQLELEINKAEEGLANLIKKYLLFIHSIPSLMQHKQFTVSPLF